jgi:hypothetical protein
MIASKLSNLPVEVFVPLKENTFDLEDFKKLHEVSFK